MLSEDTQDATNKKQKQGFSFSISDILHNKSADSKRISAESSFLSKSSNLNESNADNKIEQDESVKSEENLSFDDICCEEDNLNEDDAEQFEDECAENGLDDTLQQNNFNELSGNNKIYYSVLRLY